MIVEKTYVNKGQPETRWILIDATRARFTRTAVLLFILGSVICLFSFLLPAFPLLLQGEAAFHGYMPERFSWITFGAGFLLMATALWRIGRGTTKGIAHAGA